eukprot:7076832-Prymnesium_polylepis.1
MRGMLTQGDRVKARLERREVRLDALRHLGLHSACIHTHGSYCCCACGRRHMRRHGRRACA